MKKAGTQSLKRPQVSVGRKLHRVFFVFFLILLGLGLSLYFYLNYRQLELQETANNLTALSQSLQEKIQQKIFSIIDDLYLISHTIPINTNSDKHYDVDLARTDDILEQCLNKNPVLLGIGWAPIIHEKNINEMINYTKPYHGQKGNKFQYSSKFTQHYNFEADDLKLPVQLYLTYNDTSNLLGYDLFSEYTNRKYALIARDVGVTTATDSFMLTLDGQKKWSYIVFAPVYKNFKNTPDIINNQANIVGFVFGIFTVEDIMTNLIPTQQRNVSIEVYDSLLNKRSRLLFSKPASFQANRLYKLPEELHRTVDVDIGGLKWNVDFYCDYIDVMTIYSKLKWLVPLGILCIFSLLSIYAIHLVNYSSVIEQKVKERTLELQRTNEELNASYEELEALVEEMYDEHAKLIASEQKLLESNILLKTISENAPVMINCYNSDGDCILWNQECERQLGYTIDDVKTFNDFQNLILQYNAENYYEFEFGKFKQVKGLSKYGKEYTHMWGSFFINNKTIVNVGYDITTVLQLNELIFEKQKEEAILILAAGIAHDFNNIITGILGSTEMLIEALIEQDLPEANRCCSTIKTASLRMADLTKQLLAYAKGGKYQTKPIQINHVIQDAFNIVKSSRFKNIKYHISLDPDLWLVEADAAQISQVVINLMINAVESMDEKGGLLFVKTVNCSLNNYPYVPIGTSITGEQVCIIINDTGCGIPEEIINKIFDPFFTTKHLGRGLGLSAVKGIISNHNGYIFVKSVLVQGTTFYIYLPKYQEKLLLEADFNHTAKNKDVELTNEIDKSAFSILSSNIREQKNILVVDDEEFIRNFASNTLKRAGYNVYVASSGSEAINLFEKHINSLDLVLLDLQMPIINGFEVYEYITAKRPELKIIICTGYNQNFAEENINTKIYEYDFLPKPYLAKDLLQLTQKVLSSNHINN